MNQFISFNINFDSLNEHFMFPAHFRDPCFFECFDRFQKLSEKYNFKYSIYIIGKDMENPEYYARVRDWSQMGHEIGNHSYRHFVNLATMKSDLIEYEILKSHELITTCTGQEPVGFISPGWSMSTKIIATLIKNKYLYDTSLFPSVFLYFAVIKNVFLHFYQPCKILKILSRLDYFFPFTKPNHPFYADKNFQITSPESNEKIIILPLPTLYRFYPPLWHTIVLMAGHRIGKKLLNQYLKEYPYLYYLMHPADLLDIAEIQGKKNSIERMKFSLHQKEFLINEVMESIKHSGKKIITMKQLALQFDAENNKSNENE